MEKVQLARNSDQREIVATKSNCQPFAARYTIFVCRYTIFAARHTKIVYRQEPALKTKSIFLSPCNKVPTFFLFFRNSICACV